MKDLEVNFKECSLFPVRCESGKIFISPTLSDRLGTEMTKATGLHEVGHIKNNHPWKRILFLFSLCFTSIVLGLFLIYKGLHFLLVPIFLIPPLLVILRIISRTCFWSQEFEADEYAGEELDDRRTLIKALRITKEYLDRERGDIKEKALKLCSVILRKAVRLHPPIEDRIENLREKGAKSTDCS